MIQRLAEEQAVEIEKQTARKAQNHIEQLKENIRTSQKFLTT